jgi:hypothetical protein
MSALEPPFGRLFCCPIRRRDLALDCWVQIHLTAHDIVQIMHAHTIDVFVVGVLALARLRMSKPKD